jgi:hypothetical protein
VGQAIRFPAIVLPYPAWRANRERAEHILLIALHWWAASHSDGADPVPRLREVPDAADAHAQLFERRLMPVVVYPARRPVAVLPPRSLRLPRGKTCPLHAACLAQAREVQLTDRALRTTLLSIQGADSVFVPSEDVGTFFKEVWLYLRRWRPSGRADATPSAWMAVASAGRIDNNPTDSE